MRLRIIDIGDWDEKYQPMCNKLSDNASFGGLMYETFGEEFDAVRSADEFSVWTLIESNDDLPVIVAGLRRVGKIGYFITRRQWDEDDFSSLVVTIQELPSDRKKGE